MRIVRTTGAVIIAMSLMMAGAGTALAAQLAGIEPAQLEQRS